MIDYHLAQETKEFFDDEIELDEGNKGCTQKGKRGCGAGGKTAVFGLLKRNGRFMWLLLKIPSKAL